MFSLFLRVNRCAGATPPSQSAHEPYHLLIPTSRRVEDMRRAFADCCKRSALEIVGSDATADEERDKGLVQCLLDFKDSMETCVWLSCAP